MPLDRLFVPSPLLVERIGSSTERKPTCKSPTVIERAPVPVADCRKYLLIAINQEALFSTQAILDTQHLQLLGDLLATIQAANSVF